MRITQRRSIFNLLIYLAFGVLPGAEVEYRYLVPVGWENLRALSVVVLLSGTSEVGVLSYAVRGFRLQLFRRGDSLYKIEM